MGALERDSPAADVEAARVEPPLVQTLTLEGCEVLCIGPSADGTALFCGLDDGSLALIGTRDRTRE